MSDDAHEVKNFTKKDGKIKWIKDIHGKDVAIHEDSSHHAPHGIEWHTSLGWMVRNRWPFTVLFILVVTILGLALYKKIFPDSYEANMALLVEMVDRVFGLVLCIVLLVLGVNFFFAPKDDHGKKGGHH